MREIIPDRKIRRHTVGPTGVEANSGGPKGSGHVVGPAQEDIEDYAQGWGVEVVGREVVAEVGFEGGSGMEEVDDGG